MMEEDAGDAENNGGKGGPALFWAELYNFTSLHSNPPFSFMATTFQCFTFSRKCDYKYETIMFVRYQLLNLKKKLFKDNLSASELLIIE
jgi:hypothetical protein